MKPVRPLPDNLDNYSALLAQEASYRTLLLANLDKIIIYND